jgi:predicted nucleic acid-binding protein
VSVTCDTSVLVPLLAGWHPHHHEVRALAEDLTHVGAHVLLETFSVLTRLPAPHRVAPGAAAELLGLLPLTPVTLPADEHAGVIAQLAAQGIRGGAVYDGLVASTAARHSLLLLTRDRRARLSYDALQVQYRLV